MISYTNMGNNNSNILIYLGLFMVLSGCAQSFNSRLNSMIKRAQESMERDYNKSGLLNHFPKDIKNPESSLLVKPPTCLPSYDCRSQSGYAQLLSNLDSTKRNIPDSILFETAYFVDDNMIINTAELKRELFAIEKCNKWYPNKLPIPYFERYFLSFDEKEQIKKEVDGEMYYLDIFDVPSDLQVYVIEAEAGKFWKEDCKEWRPKALKEWQNGYSKGIAMSEKENIIVYWAMIW